MIWLVKFELRQAVYYPVKKLIMSCDISPKLCKSTDICNNSWIIEKNNIKYVGKTTLSKAIENSHLPEILVQLVDFVSERDTISVLEMCFLVARISHVCGHKMVRKFYIYFD